MPSIPPIRTLALVCVLVLAGCTAPAGSQAPQAGGTESPTPTTEAGSPTSTNGTAAPPEYPPGMTDSGVDNASALLAAHSRSLRDAGYRLTQSMADTETTYVAAPNFSSFRIVPDPAASNPAVWANETTTLAREVRDDRTVYHRPPRFWASPERMTGVETLCVLLGAGRYTPNGTRACGERRCTVLRADGSQRFRNFSARALVHRSGTVYRFHASYTGENGTAATHRFELEQRGNVSVSRPDWVGTALERA